MKYLNLSLILAAVLAAASQPAMADSSASVNTSTSGSSSFLDVIKNNMKASYLMEMTGPTAGALSGNTDGSGKSIQIDHYASLGAKLGGKWSATYTQVFSQKLDDIPEGTPGKSPAFYLPDPYISINNTRIMGSNWHSFNVFGQLRYYLPVSRATHDAVNDVKSTETGNGRIRLLIDPSFAFMDGALSVDFPLYYFGRYNSTSEAERTAKNGKPTRNDFRILPSTVIAYQLTKNVQPYLETGVYMNHTSDGEWTSNAQSTYGHYVALGTNINIGKKFTLTPIAQFGPYYFAPKKAQLTLDAVYVFL